MPEASQQSCSSSRHKDSTGITKIKEKVLQFFTTGNGKREAENVAGEVRISEVADGSFSTPAAGFETAAHRAGDVTTAATLLYSHWPRSDWGFQTDSKAATEFFNLILLVL